MSLRTAVGHIAIHRVVESICAEFQALSFFPETTPEDWARHRPWMEREPRSLDPASGNLIFPIQAFLLRTRHHTILVDSCVGDDKPRTQRPFWHMQRLDTFLPRLAAAGISPEDVDFVMCTHLHWDHIGWNTRLRDGRWVPTFPNAKYIFTSREWAWWDRLHRETPQVQITDSVLPVIEARQAQFVADDFALDDEVWLEPTPGHTVGHVSVHLRSGGVDAVITGDCIHSPVQCLEPGWKVRADLDHTLAGTTRRSFLERHCESGTLVCATHFPEPSFGRVLRQDGAFRFRYEGR